MKTIVLATAAALLVTLAPPARAADFKIVANASVPATALSKSELSDLFMKHTLRWSTGEMAQPAEPPEASPLREPFCREIHGKSAAVVRVYWSRLIFAGRSTPSVAKGSDDEGVAFVRSTPGAIGFVARATAAAGVKEIALR